MSAAKDNGPYTTDTTGDSFGTVDTRDQTWLSWGHDSREQADAVTDEANRLAK